MQVLTPVKAVVAFGLAVGAILENQTAEQAAARQDIVRMAVAGDAHADHALAELDWTSLQVTPSRALLPADELGASERLARSPRRGEFVKIAVAGKAVTMWLVHPAQAEKAPVIVVIHEVFGLSDWVRGIADQLAAEGFIAIAPDLLSGHGPNGGDTSSMKSREEIMQATLKLSAEPTEILAKLKAAREHGLSLPRANGKSASVGFCYGGNQSFEFAIHEPALDAAVVYYGQSPGRWEPPAPGTFVPSDALAHISAPMLGLYGDEKHDANVAKTIPPTVTKMKALGKPYETHVFEGAGHAFLREQARLDGANSKASAEAWPLMIAWLKKHTG